MYGFEGSTAMGLNHPSKTYMGGWYIPNYSESNNNPFVFMMNGTDIDKDTKWRIYVDKKLLACGKGPSKTVDAKYNLPVLTTLTIPDNFNEHDEQICLATIGDRKSTRLNSSHVSQSRMPSSA